MTAIQIIFILVAAATLGSALMVVTTRNLVHSALWLVASLFGVAVVYGLLNAGFLAVVQVVVYIGAIAILMIFAIMLTRKVIEPEGGVRFNANWGWALVSALILFAALAWIVSSWPGITTQAPALNRGFDPVKELGIALLAPDGYVLAFELASVLLLAALIGAIVVAWDRKQEE
jgi:NADH-quinone oxidoreductase subunit J